MDIHHPCHPAWWEYDNAAHYLAVRGIKGKLGDPLPMNMTTEAVELINDDPEAFEQRVREFAYALAMEKAHLQVFGA